MKTYLIVTPIFLKVKSQLDGHVFHQPEGFGMTRIKFVQGSVKYAKDILKREQVPFHAE